MNVPVQPAQCDEVPEIVPIVLQQAFRFLSLGRIDSQTYREQIERLEREELQPKGLALIMETRADGGRCFQVRRCKDGEVCTRLECAAVLRETSDFSGATLPSASTVYPGSASSGIQPVC